MMAECSPVRVNQTKLIWKLKTDLQWYIVGKGLIKIHILWL